MLIGVVIIKVLKARPKLHKSEYKINLEVFYLQFVPKRCWQLEKQEPQLLKRNLPSFENVSVEQSLRKTSIKN